MSQYHVPQRRFSPKTLFFFFYFIFLFFFYPSILLYLKKINLLLVLEYFQWSHVHKNMIDKIMCRLTINDLTCT